MDFFNYIFQKRLNHKNGIAVNQKRWLQFTIQLWKAKKKFNFVIIPLDTFLFFCFFQIHGQSHFLDEFSSTEPNNEPLKKNVRPNLMISFPKDLFHLEWVILSWRCKRLFHSPRNRINEIAWLAHISWCFPFAVQTKWSFFQKKDFD